MPSSSQSYELHSVITDNFIRKDVKAKKGQEANLAWVEWKVIETKLYPRHYLNYAELIA